MSDEPTASAEAHSSERPRNGSARAKAALAVQERRRKNRSMFNKKRGELLDDLLRSLDILIYAELSTVYYMDCSFLRFLIRVFVQFLLLTPKPSIFPEPPQNRPYIGMIMGANLLCLVLHMYSSPLSAGEATRGYLHGGLAMDFIGQQGPTSKLHLVALDALIVSLQLVHLSAHIARTKLKEALTVTPPGGLETAPAASVQDHDHEERGVRRSQEGADIEMQNLDPSGSAAASSGPPVSDEEPSERESLLASTAPSTDAHIFDAFNSGQIVLADLDITQTVKEQFWAYQNSSLESRSSSSQMQALEASFPGSRLGLRVRVGNRILGI